MAKTNKIKVLICDPLAEDGVKIFTSQKNILVKALSKSTHADLKKEIKDANAVVVRSGTRLTAELINASKSLRIIGRAGVGIDNVDVEAASKKGVVVVNTPGGNTISAAEHTISLMLSLARNIAPAHHSMEQGLWDRKKFTGVEMLGKTLGLVGLGRIGGEVAKRAQSFGVKVLAYDPFLRAEKARELGVVQVGFDELCRESDFISLHVPYTKETRHIINEKAVRMMKKDVRIINCARGGLIDESVALKALKSGKIAGIALDVYETEPPSPSAFLKHERVLKTPHLGASTQEAQIKVAVDVANTMVDYLNGKGIRNAVNMTQVDPEVMKEMRPYCDLADAMGRFVAQITDGQLLKIEITTYGTLSNFPLKPITLAALQGVLNLILADKVNPINAMPLAKERGIKVVETQSSDIEGFSNLLQIKLTTTKAKRLVGGVLYPDMAPRIVMVDDLRIESVAKGRLVAIENKDVPGMVGQIGSLLGKNKINIADMSVGRSKKKKVARILINVDNAVSEPLIKKLKSNKSILDAKFIQF